MRGRPPKSIEQRRADGTFNVTRHKVVPLLVGGRAKPACPKHLTGEARRAYKTLVDDLWDSRFLDSGDRLLICAAAMQYHVAMRAGELVGRLGQVYPVTRGARYGASGYTVMETNPAARVQRDLLAEFRQTCKLLGVGPAARARLTDLGVRRRDIASDIPAVARYQATRAELSGCGSDRPQPVTIDDRPKPRCPKELQGHARSAWRTLLSDLWACGILQDDDTAALVTAALHYGAAMSALELIEKHGVIYPVTRGARDGNPGYKVIEVNPAVRILRDSLSEFRQCCDLLGIGPSARARLRHLGVNGRSAIGLLPGIGAKPTRIEYDPKTGERRVLGA